MFLFFFKMEKINAILLLGPTGSGKTPLGEMFERCGLGGRRCFHFDFGSQLRNVVAAEQPPVFLSAEEAAFLCDILRSGALLENEQFTIARKILEAFIAERGITADDLLILNGLPRHIDQARDVETIVEISAVIHLSCNEEVVFERIRTNAGGDRTGRSDDDAESVREKLETFSRRIAPLVSHYRRLSVTIVTIEISVADKAESIWRRINSAFNSSQAREGTGLR